MDADVSYIEGHSGPEDIPKPGVPKKRVVLPNSNQDKWLQYLVSNLNEMTDIDWVADLLPRIEHDQDEYNAGKYRGAIFQTNFIARETRKLAIRTKNRITDASPRHNVMQNTQSTAGASFVR